MTAILGQRIEQETAGLAADYCRAACVAIEGLPYLWEMDAETAAAMEEAERVVTRTFGYLEAQGKHLEGPHAAEFADIVRWFAFGTARLEMLNYQDITRLASLEDERFTQSVDRLYEWYAPVIRSRQYLEKEAQVRKVGTLATGAPQ